MATQVFNSGGLNKTEERCIKQLERAKLCRLLDRERRLTNFLVEHHAGIILRSANKPLDNVTTIVALIKKHPQIKETNERVNNILDAYAEFQIFAGSIRHRTQSNAVERINAAIRTASKSVFNLSIR